MAVAGGPNIVEDGLVFYIDEGNIKSYKGRPLHNIVKPLNQWPTRNRISIQEVSGNDWDTPVPGARMWKCYHSGSLAVNSLTRDWNTYNPLVLPDSFGKSLYVYSMWVRGFNTNPSNSSINIDMHDRNNTSTTLNDETWKKLSLINSDYNASYPTYLFYDIFVSPYGGERVDFLITGMMLTRYYGDSYEELDAFTTTDIPWLPEGTVEETLLDLTDNASVDFTNISFTNNDQVYFDGVDDRIENIGPVHSRLSSSATEVIFKADSIPSLGYAMIFGYKHVGGSYSQFTTGPVALNNSGKIHSSVITTSQVYRSVTSTTTISTGKYYHVVLNKDTVNGTLELYINGQLESTNTFDAETYPIWGGNPQGTDYLEMGGLETTYTWDKFFNGNIPVGKLYSRTLTPQEVLQNYNALKSRFDL